MTPQSLLGVTRNSSLASLRGRRFGRSCMTILTTLHGRRRMPRVQGASEYAEWAHQNFEYRGNVVYRRSGLEPPPPLPKQHTRLRKPPNPPKEKCAVCTQFTRQGSTAYQLYEYPFDECPHEDEDSRGSSRSVHPTFCKQCCTFLDETPMELQKTRKAVSHKVLDAPLERVSIIEQLVDDSKEATFSPEMLDTILNDFASLVATSSESEAITSTKLHELLYQSIANAEGDISFSMVGDVENYGGDFAGLGICFHGDEPEIEMSDGLVHVFQETRDMYDMNDQTSTLYWMRGVIQLVIPSTGLRQLRLSWRILGTSFHSMTPRGKHSLDWGLGNLDRGIPNFAFQPEFHGWPMYTRTWGTWDAPAQHREVATFVVTACSSPPGTC